MSTLKNREWYCTAIYRHRFSTLRENCTRRSRFRSEKSKGREIPLFALDSHEATGFGLHGRLLLMYIFKNTSITVVRGFFSKSISIYQKKKDVRTLKGYCIISVCGNVRRN